MSNNLDGARIADNQTGGQHRTVNEALDLLDAAISNPVELVVPDSHKVEPPIGYIYGNFRFVLTASESAPSEAFLVELAAFTAPRGLILFLNATEQPAELYCLGQSSPHVMIPPGSSVLVDFDRLEVREVINREPFLHTVAASDEVTVLTPGTDLLTFRMPCRAFITEVRASLNVAQGGGSPLAVDINQEGASILSTKLSVDNGDKTSKGASTPAVISDPYLTDDAEISIDIDTVGSGSPAGLKITFIGYRY